MSAPIEPNGGKSCGTATQQHAGLGDVREGVGLRRRGAGRATQTLANRPSSSARRAWENSGVDGVGVIGRSFCKAGGLEQEEAEIGGAGARPETGAGAWRRPASGSAGTASRLAWTSPRCSAINRAARSPSPAASALTISSCCAQEQLHRQRTAGGWPRAWCARSGRAGYPRAGRGPAWRTGRHGSHRAGSCARRRRGRPAPPFRGRYSPSMCEWPARWAAEPR